MPMGKKEQEVGQRQPIWGMEVLEANIRRGGNGEGTHYGGRGDAGRSGNSRDDRRGDNSRREVLPVFTSSS